MPIYFDKMNLTMILKANLVAAIKPRPWGIKGLNVDFLPSLSQADKPFTPSQGVYIAL